MSSIVRVPSRVAAILALTLLAPVVAEALPSFAQQTGQPCAKCHVGGYGPQLKQYGRDFKLYGYVNGDGRNWLPPVTLIALSSFTHTDMDRKPPVAHFAPNDNVAGLDKAKVAYGGAIGGGVGAFTELTYDGVRRVLALDNMDIRRAFNPTIAGKDVVLGLDINDRPTVSDLWNSTPTFEFLPNTSSLGPLPQTSALLDMKLAQRAVGFGGYGMWDNLIYTEFSAYQPITNSFAHRLGQQIIPTSDVYDGLMPYWRLAVQHDFAENHYLSIGTFGMVAERFPTGKVSAGKDRVTDTAADFTYQYSGSERHYVSVHGSYIHESDDLSASHVLFKSATTDYLNTTRLDISYSYRDKLVPTLEYCHLQGSVDPNFYKAPNGRGDSVDYVAELAYTLWGTKDSPVGWANPRIAVRYVAYTKFNGTSFHASANNTLYVSVRVALAPFGAAIDHE